VTKIDDMNKQKIKELNEVVSKLKKDL